MITGFNTDVKYRGVVYHVQTEDKGEGNPMIETLIYKGGEILGSRGASVAFHDPLVEEAEMNGETLRSIPLTEETLASQDLVIVFIPQANVDWKLLEKHTGPIFDCCNTLPKKNPNVTRL